MPVTRRTRSFGKTDNPTETINSCINCSSHINTESVSIELGGGIKIKSPLSSIQENLDLSFLSNDLHNSRILDALFHTFQSTAVTAETSLLKEEDYLCTNCAIDFYGLFKSFCQFQQNIAQFTKNPNSILLQALFPNISQQLKLDNVFIQKSQNNTVEPPLINGNGISEDNRIQPSNENQDTLETEAPLVKSSETSEAEPTKSEVLENIVEKVTAKTSSSDMSELLKRLKPDLQNKDGNSNEQKNANLKINSEIKIVLSDINKKSSNLKKKQDKNSLNMKSLEKIQIDAPTPKVGQSHCKILLKECKDLEEKKIESSKPETETKDAKQSTSNGIKRKLDNNTSQNKWNLESEERLKRRILEDEEAIQRAVKIALEQDMAEKNAIIEKIVKENNMQPRAGNSNNSGNTPPVTPENPGNKTIRIQFRCSRCSKVFLTRPAVENHVKTHTSEKRQTSESESSNKNVEVIDLDEDDDKAKVVSTPKIDNEDNSTQIEKRSLRSGDKLKKGLGNKRVSFNLPDICSNKKKEYTVTPLKKAKVSKVAQNKKKLRQNQEKSRVSRDIVPDENNFVDVSAVLLPNVVNNFFDEQGELEL